ncbi:MAG: hypothetical protein ABA06_01545 [Parcubacteria bacterium C7867-001]|nr:MAG: hypothetical protein ABA06_01545 [Parcubacteria bacterium C7867-001]
MSAVDLLIIASAVASLGTALGAVGLTIGEVLYARALSDGKLEECEKTYVRATFWSLRSGMTLFLAGSIGTILIEYLAWDAPHTALTSSFWATLLLALVIVVSGWGLVRGVFPWTLASSAALTAWWTIFALSLVRDLSLTPLSILLGYALFTGVIFGARVIIHEHFRSSRA